MRTVVVVGASLAGLRAAEALRREGFEGGVIVVGAETHAPYDRPPLSKQLLAGTFTAEQVVLRQAEGLDVDWRLGVRATGLDLAQRHVVLEAGSALGFDGLVIATGAAARTLPGAERLAGVFVLRTLDECVTLAAALDHARRVCVIGAGFIGSEVASTARARGLDVTVVEALPVPLERVLGPELGQQAAALHRRAGTDLRLGVAVERLEDDGAGRVTAVRLADGTVVDADVVVVGIGVTPTTGWLAGSGLTLDDGVVCDQWCRALGPDGEAVAGVVAAGDVARWFNPRFGEAMRVEHWSNAVEQGAAAAVTLVKGADLVPPFAPVPYFWSDQYGTKIQFVGHAHPGDEIRLVEGSYEDGRFLAAYGRKGKMVGALSFSMPARIMAYRAMIAGDGAFPPRPG